MFSKINTRISENTMETQITYLQIFIPIKEQKQIFQNGLDENQRKKKTFSTHRDAYLILINNINRFDVFNRIRQLRRIISK